MFNFVNHIQIEKKMSNISKLIGILGDLQFDTCFKSSAKKDNIIKKEQ